MKLPGRVEAIWLKRAHRGPMDSVQRAVLDPVEGIEGNVDRSVRRQVTILERSAWARAMSEIDADIDPSARRANVLVSGVDLANTRDRVLEIGDARLLIGGEVTPCNRMNDVLPGLQNAMQTEWRGGAFAQILRRSEISVGDTVSWRSEPHPDSSISYHKAELSDIDALSRLYCEDEPGSAFMKRMTKYVAGADNPPDALALRVIYYASSAEAPIGYIAGHLARKADCDGEIQALYVTPPDSNGEVAAQLLRKLAVWFLQRGARRICVNVEPGNARERAFFIGYGAEELSEPSLVWNDIAVTV